MRKKQDATEDHMQMVSVAFTADHLHALLPFGPGDVIRTELHNALAIEAAGTGHRIPDSETDA